MVPKTPYEDEALYFLRKPSDSRQHYCIGKKIDHVENDRQTSFHAMWIINVPKKAEDIVVAMCSDPTTSAQNKKIIFDALSETQKVTSE